MKKHDALISEESKGCISSAFSEPTCSRHVALKRAESANLLERVLESHFAVMSLNQLALTAFVERVALYIRKGILPG